MLYYSNVRVLIFEYLSVFNLISVLQIYQIFLGLLMAVILLDAATAVVVESDEPIPPSRPIHANINSFLGYVFP